MIGIASTTFKQSVYRGAWLLVMVEMSERESSSGLEIWMTYMCVVPLRSTQPQLHHSKYPLLLNFN